MLWHSPFAYHLSRYIPPKTCTPSALSALRVHFSRPSAFRRGGDDISRSARRGGSRRSWSSLALASVDTRLSARPSIPRATRASWVAWLGCQGTVSRGATPPTVPSLARFHPFCKGFYPLSLLSTFSLISTSNSQHYAHMPL